jgi:hypothetical protein
MTYTVEIEKELVQEYIKEPSLATVSRLATKFDKPERSIISKLSALGIYKRKVYTSKNGEVPVRKEEYIKRISNLLEIDPSLLDSLEKVTKYALVLMEKKIRNLTEII